MGDAYVLFADIDGVGVDVVFANGLYSADEADGLNLTRCLHASVLAQKRAIHASAHDIHAQAVAYYNLGWAEHRAHVCLCAGLKKRSTRYLKAAVRCFKRAIELEAGNAEFWNALGVVTSELNPRLPSTQLSGVCSSTREALKHGRIWVLCTCCRTTIYSPMRPLLVLNRAIPISHMLGSDRVFWLC